MSDRVLIVEDELHQANSLKGLLEVEGHLVDACQTGEEALKRARNTGYELILCDLRLPDMDGMEIFHRMREALGDDAPTFTILTAYGTVEAAREALKGGVYDFITKPVDPTELAVLVKNVLERRRLRRENLELSRRVGALGIEDRLVGRSPSFREMLDIGKAAAESEATILIRGESGTGKEMVAELIHHASPRRDGPFIKVNCSAIPETLLESELFGHEEGAFTDAHRSRKGRFELADGGTIFLDEIGDMSPALQVKLLRVLQERELERLGGQGKVIPLDFRLVAATNRNLEEQVADGTFREDLYYRVNVITIEVPPLRERPGDVELLANSFCVRFNEKNNKSFRGLAVESLERLSSHQWPGNVRELENVIERAVVLGQGDQIRPEHLADFDGQARPTATTESDDLVDQVMDSKISIDAMERELIRQALDRSDGNVTQASRILGVTRRTLQYRIEKHALNK